MKKPCSRICSPNDCECGYFEQPAQTTGVWKVIAFIAILFFIVAVLCSACSKASGEVVQKEKRVYIVSERYTNPPEWATDTTWKPYTIKKVALSPGVDFEAYRGVIDTLISTCSIDKVDSAFKIEIRKFTWE